LEKVGKLSPARLFLNTAKWRGGWKSPELKKA